MVRRVIFIFLLGIILLVAKDSFAFASENEKMQIRYTLISAQGLMRVNSALRRNIRANFAEVGEEYLEYNSQEAKKYIEDLDIKFVPFVIFGQSVTSADNFAELIRNKMLEELKGHYVIPEEQLRMKEVMLLGRERQPNRLDMYVRPSCPDSKKAEVKLINYIRENNLEIALQLKNVDDIQESQELKISRTPTFLWENVHLIPTLTELKRYPPFDKKKAVKSFTEELAPGPIPIDFFYSQGCRSCARLKKEFLPQIELQYQDKIAINYHDITNRDELELKFTMEEEYGILGGSVPQVYLPTVVLENEATIRKNLTKAIEESLARKARPLIERIIPKRSPILDKFLTFSPAVITLAGLLDGINPCAFATIVFFVSLLTMSSYRKRQIAYIGGTFILAVFLTYLALGFGIFGVLNKLQIFAFFAQLIYYVVAVLALGLGIYSLCDFIYYKKTGIGLVKGCDIRLYNRLRALVESKRGLFLLIAATFVNGFIIALLESACTGQVYFPTIAFVMKMSNLKLYAIIYLLLYNLAFILPLVIIFVLAYQGLATEKVAQFMNRHLGGIKLASAFLFFGLAALLFIYNHR